MQRRETHREPHTDCSIPSVSLCEQLCEQVRWLTVDTGTLETQVLLAHGEPAVRAKVCNLLGNLCRHSAHCYPALLRHSILPRLLTRLSDPDKSTRKFACFAVGNASFHNDSVRHDVAPCCFGALPQVKRKVGAESGCDAAGIRRPEARHPSLGKCCHYPFAPAHHRQITRERSHNCTHSVSLTRVGWAVLCMCEGGTAS